MAELWRAVPDEAWHHRVGDLLPSTQTPTGPTVDAIARTDALITSLQGDVNHEVSQADFQTERGQGMVGLQMEITGFDARWLNFKTAFDAHETTAVETALDQNQTFLGEFHDIRRRFIALGGVPSMDPEQDALLSNIETFGSILPYVAGAAVLWFLSPYLLPLLGIGRGK